MTNVLDTPFFPALLAVLAAAFAQSCYQLSVSVLTLLSGHSLGAKRSHTRLLHLDIAYSFGAFACIALLLFGLIYVVTALPLSHGLLWSVAAGLCIGTGVAMGLFYYRHGKGTLLWVPRPVIDYLTERTKKTQRSVEAFVLGATAVIAEFPLVLAPLLVVGLVLRGMPSVPHVGAVLGYSLLCVFPLMLMTGLLGGGHKLSTIQRWRETNKTFFQYTSGLVLLLLGVYIIVAFRLEQAL